MPKYIIFGSGDVGIKCKNLLEKKGIEIIGYADNNPNKQGKNISGIPIISPDSILGLQPDGIAIGLYKAVNQVKKQLVDMGIPEDIITVPLEPNRIFYNNQIFTPIAMPPDEQSKTTQNFLKKRKETEDKAFLDKLESLKQVMKEMNIPLNDICICGGGILQAYGLRKSRLFDDIDIIMMSEYRAFYGAGLVIVSDTAEMHKQDLYEIKDDDIILNPENHFVYRNLKFVRLDIYYNYLCQKKMSDEIDLARMGL